MYVRTFVDDGLIKGWWLYCGGYKNDAKNQFAGRNQRCFVGKKYRKEERMVQKREDITSFCYNLHNERLGLTRETLDDSASSPRLLDSLGQNNKARAVK